MASPRYLLNVQRRSALYGALVGLIFCLPSLCRAQTCLGGVDFREGPVVPNAGIELGGGARGVGVGVQGGAEEGFGGVSVFRFTDDVSSWTTFGIRGGFILTFDDNQTAFCPVAEISFASIPSDFGSVSVRSMLLGIAGGAVLAASPETQVVPFTMLGYSTVRVDAALGEVDFSASGDSFIAALGAGLRFSQVGAATVRLSIPVASGAEPVLEVGFQFLLP